jgi:hypothetical protein
MPLQRSHRIRTIAIEVTILFIVASASFARAQVSPKPLSEDEIVRLLKGDVSPKRVAELARERGLSFELTPEAAGELRNAGAGDELLSTLRELSLKSDEIPLPANSSSQRVPPPGVPKSTKLEFRRAEGDMGVMSGLIARNHEELDELKRRGDRDYYEFTIVRWSSGQKVGPTQLTLNKTDPKKSKYTLTVTVDDRTIEKKDKTAGEPVQFYVKGASRMAPYEIVVFYVNKDGIMGYLSTPKSQ